MWHNITAFGQHTRSNDVGRGIQSSPFGSTNGRTTSGMACHHSPWMANTVGRRQALHAITAFGQHTRSNVFERGIPSLPLGSTHGQTTSGVACHHSPWTAQTVCNVGRGMTLPPLDSTHGRTTSGVAFHHGPSTTHTVERRRAWHAIIALGRIGSNDVGRSMPSSLLN